MTAALTAAPRTFLSPGQRFIQLGEPAWQTERHFTIARLDQDRHGIPRVTFHAGDGREVVAYVCQVEAAISGGDIVPVVASDRLAG